MKYYYQTNNSQNISSKYLPDSEPHTLTESTNLVDKKNKPSNIMFPVIVDTEYKSRPHTPRERLTIQVKPFNASLDESIIFDDWDSVIPCEFRRHKTPRFDDIIKSTIYEYSDTDEIEFLHVQGYDDDLEPCIHGNLKKPLYMNDDDEIETLPIDEYEELPIFQFVMYSHFATAELFTITRKSSFTEQVLKKSIYVEHSLKSKPLFLKSYRNYIDNKRRLTTAMKSDNSFHNKTYIDLFYATVIDGKEYRTCLSIVDTSSWGSYENLLNSANIELDDKHLFTRGDGGEITRMDEMYLLRPNDFDTYSLNDLRIDEALKNINESYFLFREKLNIDGTSLRKLTDGAHVEQLITGRLKQKFPLITKIVDLKHDLLKGMNPKKELILGCSSYYARLRDQKLAIASKVVGGRCRNNAPLITFADNSLVDLDIGGCYGDGMRIQSYALGRPRVLKTDYSLAEFWKLYHDKLEYGLWFVHVNGDLQYSQDLIQSWCKTDEIEGDEDEVFDVHKGYSKIFRNRVTNGVITSDYMAVILELGESERKDIMNNLRVTTFAGHLKEDEFTNEEDLINAWFDYKEKNDIETDIRLIGKNTFYGWIKTSMGDLLLDDLITIRKIAQIEKGKGSLEDNESKLAVNTCYGVMASPYFGVGNVIAANNVTGRARVLVWMMEKGLNAYHSITDGGAFNPNKVVYPKKGRTKLYGHEMACINDRKKKDPHYVQKPLFDTNVYFSRDDKNELIMTFETGEIYHGKTVLEKINKKAWEHLLFLFPNHPITSWRSTSLTVDEKTKNRVYTNRVGLYEFETKDCYSGGSFHGTANYTLDGGSKDVLKYRSYESEKQYYALDGSDMYESDNPAQLFLKSMKKNDNRMPIFKPFLKTGLIKLGDYRQRKSYFQKLGLLVGDEYAVTGLLNPFSLSQFTCNDEKQYQTLEKKIAKMKLNDGWTFERFFVSKCGRFIHYKDLVKTVEMMIRDGQTDIQPYLKGKYALTVRAYKEKLKEKHPHFEELLSWRKELESKDGKRPILRFRLDTPLEYDLNTKEGRYCAIRYTNNNEVKKQICYGADTVRYSQNEVFKNVDEDMDYLNMLNHTDEERRFIKAYICLRDQYPEIFYGEKSITCESIEIQEQVTPLLIDFLHGMENGLFEHFKKYLTS